MDFWFKVVKRFGPQKGESWTSYISWAELPHLKEVVSLDNMLCPSIIDKLTTEDWQQNIQEHFRTDFFYNLDYLLTRTNNAKDVNILAVIFEPESDVKNALADTRFSFYGYDLIEEGSGISAVNNCGGFEKAFKSSEVSEFGLIDDFVTARTIQKRLIDFYPEEIHAECDLWAIWRMDNH